jgi:hypothetical protein
MFVVCIERTHLSLYRLTGKHDAVSPVGLTAVRLNAWEFAYCYIDPGTGQHTGQTGKQVCLATAFVSAFQLLTIQYTQPPQRNFCTVSLLMPATCFGHSFYHHQIKKWKNVSIKRKMLQKSPFLDLDSGMTMPKFVFQLAKNCNIRQGSIYDNDIVMCSWFSARRHTSRCNQQST